MVDLEQDPRYAPGRSRTGSPRPPPGLAQSTTGPFMGRCRCAKTACRDSRPIRMNADACARNVALPACGWGGSACFANGVHCSGCGCCAPALAAVLSSRVCASSARPRACHRPRSGARAIRAGYLWIATADGLARYDGLGMRVWRHQPGDPQGLPGNNVRALMVSGDDRVWSGDRGRRDQCARCAAAGVHPLPQGHPPGIGRRRYLVVRVPRRRGLVRHLRRRLASDGPEGTHSPPRWRRTDFHPIPCSRAGGGRGRCAVDRGPMPGLLACRATASNACGCPAPTPRPWCIR